MNLSDAKIIAEHKFSLIAPCCQLIHIAGGIRREKAEPHDIEIVCLPLFDLVEEKESDLWGEKIIASTSQVSEVFTKAVSQLGKVIKGEATGRMMQIELPEDITLDLFMPTTQDYYRQLAIRTGSADYSYKVKLLPPYMGSDYYILWEVDEWKKVPPVDPYLLRRITSNFFVVLAGWNLTELERAAMAGRMS